MQRLERLMESGGSSRRGRHAFTLMELIIVTAIVAALMAVILPTAKGLSEMARVIQCGSQFRSLAIAHTMYGKANEDRKPPLSYETEFISPNTKRNSLPIGQGLLVQAQLVNFDQLLCPGWPNREDRENDKIMWESQTWTYSGSSYLYYWRHEQDLQQPPQPFVATYKKQLLSGRMPLAMDCNMEGMPSGWMGVFENRWSCHETVGLLNVLLIDGTVKEYDFNKVVVRLPGRQDQLLETFDAVNNTP